MAVALGGEDFGLALSLGAEYFRLLFALGDGDGGLARAFRLGDGGAAQPFGGHLAVHRFLNVARRLDFADFDLRHLDSPALGYVVQLRAQFLVDSLALGEDVVHVHLADDGAEGGCGYADNRAVVVHDLQDGLLRLLFHDSHVHEEVYVDGRVVERDVRLARDVQHFLAQVHRLRGVEGPEEQV